MKKTILFLAALCFCAFINKANAQFNGKNQLPAFGNFQTSPQATEHAATGNSRGTILSQGFEGDLTGWIEENSSTANKWAIYLTNSDFSAHGGTKYAGHYWHETSTQARNAWLFSPGMAMTAGTTYTISFWLHLAGWQQDNEYDYLEVKIAQTQSGAGMGSGTTLYSNTNQWVSNWTLISKTFTPTASGTYYLGFHAFTPATQGNVIAIDDIEVSSSGGGGGDFSGGTGTENDPYIITTAQQLALLATYTNAGNTDYNNKFYKLGNDISLSAYQSGTGWTPIGKGIYNFSGHFDGNAKKITGLYINDANTDEIGLFGSISHGNIKNLALENVNVIGKSNVGSVAGFVYSASYLTNCYSTGEVNGNSSVGGLIGYINSGSVLSSSYSTCKVSGNKWVGGITGESGSSLDGLFDCYSTGEVSGNEYVGGVAGYFYGSLKNCTTLNLSVKGVTDVGRIAGSSSGVAKLVNNAAWNGILNNNGNTTWYNKGENQLDGADMSLQAILADGTLGGRFTGETGWTTQNGKLPGLFGKPVELPAHLGGVGVGELQITNYELRVYPNPTNGELRVES